MAKKSITQKAKIAASIARKNIEPTTAIILEDIFIRGERRGEEQFVDLFTAQLVRKELKRNKVKVGKLKTRITRIRRKRVYSFKYWR